MEIVLNSLSTYLNLIAGQLIAAYIRSVTEGMSPQMILAITCVVIFIATLVTYIRQLRSENKQLRNQLNSPQQVPPAVFIFLINTTNV